MDQRSENACGAHKLGEAIKGSYFDYTCDDCMLPYNHKEPEDEDYINGAKNHKKIPRRSSKRTKKPPF